jgi:hypothetical protein
MSNHEWGRAQAQAMIAKAAAPMATSEPIPTTGVARAAPAVSGGGDVLLASGSPGRPDDEVATTVVVTDAVEETEAPEASPVRTMSVVVPGGAPEVGIGCPGGGRITLVVVSAGRPLLRAEEMADSAGGGAYDGFPGWGMHSVTVTVAVTVAAGAQTTGRLVSLCDAERVEQCAHSQKRRQPRQAQRQRGACSRTC